MTDKLIAILKWIFDRGYAYYISLFAFFSAGYSLIGLVRHALGEKPLDMVFILLGIALVILSTGLGLLMWKIAKNSKS